MECAGIKKIDQTEKSTKQDKASQIKNLTPSDTHYLTKRWPGQVLHASYNTHARGVVILIHKTIPFKTTRSIQDPLGRFIIVQGNLLSLKLNLINIYGPNEDNPAFF